MQTLTNTTAEFNFSAWEDELIARFSTEIAAHSLETPRLSGFLNLVEEELQAGLDPADMDMIACCAGCGTCCRVNVATLHPEACNIAAYLRRTLSAAERSELLERMSQTLVVIHGLDDDERIAANQACVFLDESENCSIYPVRPLLCRSITSTCAERCRASLRAGMFEEPAGILMNMFQKELMDTAFTALAQMWETSGGDSRSRELTAAVYPLLQH